MPKDLFRTAREGPGRDLFGGDPNFGLTAEAWRHAPIEPKKTALPPGRDVMLPQHRHPLYPLVGARAHPQTIEFEIPGVTSARDWFIDR